jgi:hypothetical protein
MDLYTESFDDVVQEGEESRSVFVVEIDRIPSGPPVHDVIPCARIFDSKWAGHETNLI